MPREQRVLPYGGVGSAADPPIRRKALEDVVLQVYALGVANAPGFLARAMDPPPRPRGVPPHRSPSHFLDVTLWPS